MTSDAFIYDAIRTHAQLDYPNFELLFGLRDWDTAARADIERLANTPSQPVADTSVASPSSMRLQWGAFLASGDERHIVRILDACGWNKKEAARILEISRGTLYRKILEFGLEPQSQGGASRNRARRLTTG